MGSPETLSLLHVDDDQCGSFVDVDALHVVANRPGKQADGEAA